MPNRSSDIVKTPDYEGSDQESALNQLVRSTAYTANCSWAVFYREIGNALIPHMSFGVSASAPFASVRALWSGAGRELSELLIVNDAVPDFDTPSDAPIRFLGLVPVRSGDDEMIGVLAVADGVPHAGLSAAQIYVLRTLAVQLASPFHARGWRATDNSRSAFASERLRLLESVVVHANDAVLITDAEPIDLPAPRVVYCNAACTRTTGYTEADVLGKTPRVLQNEKSNRQFLDRLRAALEQWSPVEVELLNTRKDGSEFWVELSIVPVANERGWYTHWVSVQRDVSQRKQAEDLASRARLADAQNLALEAKLLERQRNEEKLAYAASHDDLTKLHNRAYLMDRLNKVFRRLRNGQRLEAAVLYLDMDRFKLVNDSLGHRVGDLLLMEMARRLESCLRAGDTLARFGGDEFVILVEGKEHERAAVHLAERIIERMTTPFMLSGQSIFSSSSIGIVNITEDYACPEDLLRDADIAMYAAKADATRSYAIFAGVMRERAVEALALQNDLRQAITEGHFALHYQPIYCLRTQTLHGVEALLRWHHPIRGSVAPDVFIPVAEEIGVIRDIGRWVINEACAQLRYWDIGYPEHALHLNINVSAIELSYPEFVAELKAALDSHSFPASRLNIEVTENVFIAVPERAGEVLAALRNLGVRIALDDFGTGYSALEFIDKYEIDLIKIDRAFIQRMFTHTRTMAIVQSVLKLGKALDLDIVAEGVETWQQYDKLATMNCPLAQGFLLWQPMPPNEMAQLLKEPCLAPTRLLAHSD